MFVDIPTLKEMGYPVVMELFRGISMPKGTPDAVINKLADAFKKGADDADFKKIAKQKGFNISFMGNKEFEAYLKVQNANIAAGMKLGGLVK
jgi:tripartite-type tricarboxylate transporter receptor subunit TctC